MRPVLQAVRLRGRPVRLAASLVWALAGAGVAVGALAGAASAAAEAAAVVEPAPGAAGASAGAGAAGAPDAKPAAAAAEAEVEATPRTVVESLHAVLLDCMRSQCGTAFEDRYERIVRELDEVFDLPFMARISIGRAWRDLSAEEREAFVALSRRYSASNYASNFDGWDGQHFETLGEEPAARGTILVKTEFVQPNDDNVRFDYRLRRADGGWRIIDVTLDGKVSEMTLRRADYTSVIERDGYAKLVEAIEKKIDNYANE